jgi:hypothetical protein
VSLLVRDLGALLGRLGLKLGFRLLPPHDFLGVAASLLDREHLELLDGVGHRADLVLAVETRQDDVEVAAGQLQHGLLDRHQRPGHATRHQEDHAGGHTERRHQEAKLQHEAAHRD